MTTLAQRKKTPWSKQFFICASIFAGVISLEICLGQTIGKHPREIRRLDHVGWFTLPLLFLIFGLVFRAFEKKEKKNA